MKGINMKKKEMKEILDILKNHLTLDEKGVFGSKSNEFAKEDSNKIKLWLKGEK